MIRSVIQIKRPSAEPEFAALHRVNISVALPAFSMMDDDDDDDDGFVVSLILEEGVVTNKQS